jgi:uncharacterized protein YkwD
MKYILWASAIVAGAAFTYPSPVASCTPVPKVAVNASTPKPNTITRILGLTNQERLKLKLAALKPSSALNLAAQRHAEDLLRSQTFSHVGSTGSRLTDRVGAANYQYEYVGENIYMQYPQNLPDAAVIGWMNSPGHRRNILNNNYTEIGLGYATDGNKHYYVQVFGKSVSF